MATPEPIPEPEQDPKEHAYEVVGGLINEVMANGDFIAAEEAMRINQKMQKEHPIEHLAFLDGEAYHVYYEKIRSALDSSRQRARMHAGVSEFEKAAAKRDKKTALKVFVTWRHKIDKNATQRSVGEMTGKDHIFVADEYQRSKEESAMLEAFHRAVAKKVGRKKTSDVLTEEQFLELYHKITQG